MANFNMKNYNMNVAFFNRANTNNNTFNNASDKFETACKDLSAQLMLNNRRAYFDISVFLDDYFPKVKSGQYTLRRAFEKYVLDAVYGKNKMNAKFSMKYNGSASNKLAKLLAIRKYINNPSNWKNGNFRWGNINDPDYYDLRAAENRSNINWYTNSLNGRIAYYTRKNKNRG
jgi:hypothetical protein